MQKDQDFRKKVYDKRYNILGDYGSTNYRQFFVWKASDTTGGKDSFVILPIVPYPKDASGNYVRSNDYISFRLIVFSSLRAFVIEIDEDDLKNTDSIGSYIIKGYPSNLNSSNPQPFNLPSTAYLVETNYHKTKDLNNNGTVIGNILTKMSELFKERGLPKQSSARLFFFGQVNANNDILFKLAVFDDGNNGWIGDENGTCDIYCNSPNIKKIKQLGINTNLIDYSLVAIGDNSVAFVKKDDIVMDNKTWDKSNNSNNKNNGWGDYYQKKYEFLLKDSLDVNDIAKSLVDPEYSTECFRQLPIVPFTQFSH